MNYSRFAICLLLGLAIALFASCGGRQIASTNGTSINSAIAELDAITAPSGTDADVFNQLKDALRSALLERGDGKLVATPPTGTANAIPDLVITDNGNGTFNYSWHYYNVGDYNQDGTVGVADITPLAMHFNQTWNKAVPAEVNTLQAVADGGSNEKVDISDVTPIAMNFGVQVSSYRLEVSATENGAYTQVQIIPLSAGLDKDIARMRFSIDITPDAGMWYRLVPVDGDGNGGVASNAMQPPSAVTVWGHSWGSTDDDQAYSVATDDDGNTFAAGTYNSGSGNADAVLIKYSSAGTLLWVKTWGGTGDDHANDVTVDGDGNAYVTGRAEDFSAVAMVFILKYAPDGTLLWQKTWGGDHVSNGMAIALDDTGLLYVTGYVQYFATGKDCLLLLKYDTNGNYIDMKALSANENLSGNALAFNSSGDIYIAGRTKAPSQVADMLIVKYSATGMLLEWQKHWGGDGADEAWGISLDASGDVYVAGRAYSTGVGQGGYDVVLMKLNPSGSVIWQESWGGTTHDDAYGMTIDNDANLYLVGGTYGFGSGRYKGLVLKFDSNGASLWAKTWSNPDNDENLRGIALYPDGKLALAGWNPMMNGTWGDASAGVTETQSVTLADTTYAEVSPAGADSIPAGVEGTPSGVQDTGGGGDDILVLQADPAGW